MKQIVIENPVLNPPYVEPTRHFKFDESGITDTVLEHRRPSSYFIPVDSRRQADKRQVSMTDEWSSDRIRENDFINRLRVKVGQWRTGGYPYVTNTTRKLLEYWGNTEREKRIFFCQLEAVETVIYLTEVAHKVGDDWLDNALQGYARDHNPSLLRMALKMATGTGKTVVMAMLIAYHALNKFANPQDRRFTDRFLLVTPGITIRDRLRVLLPSDPDNYYRQRDIIPAELIAELHRARIAITNYHAFQLREKEPVARLTKSILAAGEGAFTETPDEMVSRVLRNLGGLSSKKEIIVINDEAHHCWRSKPVSEEEKYKGDEKREAESNAESARVWISGLEAIQKKLGIKAVYDLSATPFFLKGSGYPEGTLFPWVVSDFSLIDAIESGIVKVPRVPIDDDAGHRDGPTYRYIWPDIKDHLPKKGRNDSDLGAEPKLPAVLQGALHSLYANYEKTYHAWQADEAAKEAGRMPPVMIVVCNNTSVSKLVYDYVAGWEKKLPDDACVLVPGRLRVFSNVHDGKWIARPNTLLIDSEQLESGEGLSDDFRRAMAQEIEEFRHEYKLRFPGSNADDLADEDILREVMNTVGKHGKLGEHIKCVVSVSMLTEGWDANTVTHILGIRAFSTQLLCEQVVGRALRRVSYALGEDGTFPAEYAEVYGVPFSFIPTNGAVVTTSDKPVKFTRVRALETRTSQEITFPKVQGYRYELPGERLAADFGDPKVKYDLSTKTVPSWTKNAPIIGAGASEILTLEDLKKRREQEVDFLLAKLVLEKYFRTDGAERTERKDTDTHDPLVKAWLFPQVLDITRRWRQKCVHLRDNAFPQMLLFVEYAHDAADRIFSAIVGGEVGDKVLLPRLYDYNPVGSTRAVDFDTAKETYSTGFRCPVSHVVCDSSWEEHMAKVLEGMPDVVSYVKNQGLGFSIPYTIDGESRSYLPDFIVRVDDGCGPDDLLNLIVEVSGESRKDKDAKVRTARTLWVPAINNHRGFGRWAFIEITDPWDAANTIQAFLKTEATGWEAVTNG